MIPRIKSVTPLPDYCLSVSFDDGRRVRYDVKEDFALPGYGGFAGCTRAVPAGAAGRKPDVRILERRCRFAERHPLRVRQADVTTAAFRGGFFRARGGDGGVVPR